MDDQFFTLFYSLKIFCQGFWLKKKKSKKKKIKKRKKFQLSGPYSIVFFFKYQYCWYGPVSFFQYNTVWYRTSLLSTHPSFTLPPFFAPLPWPPPELPLKDFLEAVPKMTTPSTNQQQRWQLLLLPPIFNKLGLDIFQMKHRLIGVLNFSLCYM